MENVQPKASHFINGQYVEDKAGAAIEVIYPATGKKIAQVHSATADIMERAVASSQAAQSIWAMTSGAERGRVLRKAAELIRATNRELSILETMDTGKPLQETLVADATSGADALEYFGAQAAVMTGEHIQLGEDFAYTTREPLGVCLGIGAWNYPTQIACWKAAPALACGNSLIFKPSEMTPLGALKLAEIFIEAGAPAGLFNVVQGLGDVGANLVGDPRIKKVSLTGSVPTGRKVYAAAAENLKHVTLELGGKSPMLVFKDAIIDDAVSAAINGNFYSSGQICSNGTRVFVHQSVMEEFLQKLKSRSENANIGDPLDEAVNFGPMVSEAQMNKVLSYIEIAKSEGARLICGGERLDREGFYLAPTVFADVTDDMTIAREEIFGPVMSVLSFEYEEDALARANATGFGLAAAVFTQNLARAHRVVGKLEAGTCWINTYNLTPVEMPFGGVKDSGLGRENSKHALDHYSQVKTIYVATTPVEAAF